MADDTDERHEAEAPETRGRYAHLSAIDTRWGDNDMYGHVNNVVYYSYIDTAVNRWLIERGTLDAQESPAIGVVVETGCRFFRSLSFPDRVTAGVRVGRVGRSSVRYEVGIFRGDDAEAAAVGHFVHVYVDRDTRRPVPVPDHVRRALEELRVGGDGHSAQEGQGL